ncbi:MAG: hypothetical protein P4N59_14425 [Negativicutes bacterium]|nr:hypothetical protein [Negativicutes bacterium]
MLDGCRKIFGAIILFIVLGSFIIPLLYRVVNPSDIERREQNLRAEFQIIAHPEGAKQIRFSMNHKIVMRWIRAEYKYDNMSDSELEKYYYQELTRQGWVKQQVSEEYYKRFHTSTYRKGDYEISLSPNEDSWSMGLYYRDIFDRFGL